MDRPPRRRPVLAAPGGTCLDWADFSALAEHGLAARDASGDLREALTLVRGQPFTGCYHWWLDLAFAETVRAQIVDAAEMLASLELACRGSRPRPLAPPGLDWPVTSPQSSCGGP
jgi:hypothetical protein